MEIKRSEIVDYWLKKLDEKKVLEILEGQEPCLNKSKTYNILKIERLQFNTKWKNSSYTKNRFMKTNATWLQVKLNFPLKQTVGPKKKTGDKCGRKTKLNQVREIREEYSTEQLGLAAAAKIRASGHRLAANIVENIAKSPDIKLPSSAQKSKVDAMFSPEEAVALISRNDLSKAKYMDLQASSLLKGVNLYPPYDKVLSSKKECYPSGIEIRPAQARVPLQDLHAEKFRLLNQ